MNILFFSNIFPDDQHRARGAFNYELCRALAVENDVRVIAPRPWTEAVPDRLSGRTYCGRPNPEGHEIAAAYPVSWFTPKILREHYGGFLWHSTRGAIRRMAASFTPHVVLSYWAHPDGEAGLRAARELAIPAAVIVGGSDVLMLPSCPKRGEQVRRVLHASDAIITISEGLRQRVLELGVAARRVHTIRQGVNPNLFFPGDRQAARIELASRHPGLCKPAPLLLWVGRMVDVKRLDVLVAAAEKLRRRGRDFVLALAGDGPRRQRVARMVKQRHLDDFVYFAGSQAPESLGAWYRAADVTVLSSESEGLPNVLRESLACGTPFVSTNVGSIAEIADESYAVLVEAGDAQALADGVETVLGGPHQQHARRYEPRTWDAMADDVVSLLHECGVDDGATRLEEEAAYRAC